MATTLRIHPGTPLPFYPGCTLETVAAGAGLALLWQDRPFILDWTNAALYGLNDAGALHLTRRTVAAYVKFFFNVVWGRGGCYALLEPDDPIAWLPWATGDDKEIIRNLLQPLQVIGIDGDGMFRIEGTVCFSDYLSCALFRSSWRVAPRAMPVFDAHAKRMVAFSYGQLQLVEDETLLLPDIPVAVPTCPWPSLRSGTDTTRAPADDDCEVIENYDDYDLPD